MAELIPMLCIPTTRDFPVQTVVSLMDTKQLCVERGIKVISCIVTGCSTGAFDARNRAAHEFLKTPCTHLFFVDSDMTWRAEDFVRLLAIAVKHPFVAGVYPQKKDKVKFAYRLMNDGTVDGLQTGDLRLKSDEYGCVKAHGVGLGFACIQRKVIEGLAAKAPFAKTPDGEAIPHIFRCEIQDGEMWGEDIVFCKDVMGLGYEINIYPKIELGHVGQKEYRYGSVSDTWKSITQEH